MKKSNPKVIMITIGLFLFMTIIMLNVMYVSITKKHFRTGIDILAFQENKALEDVVEVGKRGTIYDRNGEVIAQDIERYQVYLVLDKNLVDVATNTPLYVTDIQKTAQVLNKHTGIPIADAVAILSNPDAKQVEIGNYGRALSKEKKEALEQEQLPGIRFKQVLERVYPTAKFASNILGYARYNSEHGRIIGEMGIEGYLDDYLKGEDGLKRYTIGKNGQVVPGQEKTIKLVKNGNDVYLTLDKNIQSALETLLEEDNGNERWAVVMNAKTGELLGTATSTGFDLNTKDIKSYSNLISDISYEPGSTAKVFTYAAAIDSNNLDEQKLVQSGSYHIGLDDNGNPIRLSSENGAINTIKDAFNENHGMITYKQGLAYSTNTTAVDLLVNHMKKDIYLSYLEKFKLYENIDVFGLNSVTGVQNTDGPLEMLNTAFGQGSSTTALNIVQGFSAIVNNGIMSKPYIVDYIIDQYSKQKVYQNNKVQTEILKRSTAEKMNEFLRAPVEEDYGTVRRYRLADTKLLGKSGTAEMVIDGKYSSTEFIKSVLIAAPADDPQFIFYYAEQAGYYENLDYGKIQTALKSIVNTLAINSKVKSQEVQNFKVSIMPNLINHTIDYANTKLSDTGASIVNIGDGKSVINQYPLAEDHISTNRKVFLYTGGNITMPNMVGWSYKEVATFSRLSGIGISLKGSGVVESQNISEGSVLTNDSNVEVQLK